MVLSDNRCRNRSGLPLTDVLVPVAPHVPIRRSAKARPVPRRIDLKPDPVGVPRGAEPVHVDREIGQFAPV